MGLKGSDHKNFINQKAFTTKRGFYSSKPSKIYQQRGKISKYVVIKKQKEGKKRVLNWERLFRKINNLIFETDWTKFPQFILLSIAFFFSRIPYLNSGFGTDCDAWALAVSSSNLNNASYYSLSRFPGYPLVEYTNSIIIDYGWIATNLLTMLLFFVSIFFFGKIMNEMGVKNRGILLPTYAFMPLLWINSTNSMDYAWSLTFIVLCWYSVLRDRYLFAGILLGFAIASRPTAIFLAIPFFYLVWVRTRTLRKVALFEVTAAVSGGLFFVPIYLQFGTKFIRYYPMGVTLGEGIDKVFYLFGSIATLLLIVLFIFSHDLLLNKLENKDERMKFLILSLLVVAIPFIYSPIEAEYLIPSIPFMLILANDLAQTSLRKKILALMCVFAISNAFVVIDINANDPDAEFVFETEEGILDHEMKIRDRQYDVIQGIYNADIVNHSYVVLDRSYCLIYPFYDQNISAREDTRFIAFTMRNWDRDIIYVSTLPKAQLDQVILEGYQIYYLPWMKSSLEQSYGYDITEYGAIMIPVVWSN